MKTLSNIFYPTPENLVSFEAPLKTVSENLLRGANDYFVKNSAAGFSALTPHLYNTVYLAREDFSYTGAINGAGMYFDSKIIKNNNARNQFTGIGMTWSLNSPESQFKSAKYEDWCFYYQLTPVKERKWGSSAIPSNPATYDNIEVIHTNYKYSPTRTLGTTGVVISTPEANMGLDNFCIISKPLEAPTPSHDYDNWLFCSEWSFYNRAAGATTDRVKLVKTDDKETISPAVIWDIQNYFYYIKTGGKPRAAEYNGNLQGVIMCNPYSGALSLSMLGDWRLIETHQLKDDVGITSVMIDKQFHHKSTLGANIKYLLPEREADSNYYEWIRTETESIYRSPSTDNPVLAFKSEDDFKALLADWGVTRITNDSTEAQSMPSELFPGYTPEGDDSFNPDGGNNTGFGTNPTVPTIPSYSDNTSDKIEPTTPNISAINAASVYALSLSGVKSLLRWLMTEDFTKNISELFSDKLSAIDDLKILPFDIVNHDTTHTQASESLTIANVTGAVTCHKIIPNYNCIIEGGSYHYTAYWGDFNDYTSASYYLYIPYGGIVELSPSFVVNRDLRLLYALDIMSGNATAVIYSNGVFVKTVPCQMGQTIPITYTNTNQREIKNTLAAMNAGTTLINMAAGKTDILGGVLNIGNTIARTAMTNPLTIGSIGNFSANTSIIMPQNPFLIISRIQQAIPESMEGIIGKPSNTHNNISAFVGSGFVQINASHINTTATTEEQSQIISLLQNGIFI